MFETILFPVDQSREAREAADMVASVAQAYQSKVLVLAVVNEAATTPSNSTKLLTGVKEFLLGQGISHVETLDRTGNPPFVICDVADEMDVNLIVMGSKGETLTETEHPESVSHRVIDLTPCPVLIVP